MPFRIELKARSLSKQTLIPGFFDHAEQQLLLADGAVLVFVQMVEVRLKLLLVERLSWFSLIVKFHLELAHLVLF